MVTNVTIANATRRLRREFFEDLSIEWFIQVTKQLATNPRVGGT